MKRFACFVMVLAGVFVLAGSVSAQPRYVQFPHLNHTYTDVTSEWTKLKTSAEPHSFSTISKYGILEVHVNSWFSVGLVDGGVVEIQVRIDDRPADFDNWGALKSSYSSAFLSLFAVFVKVPAGRHTVSLWARTVPSGTASSIIVDCGGLRGAMIIKETL